MADTDDVDYGPLASLVGTWRGDKGMDVAPVGLRYHQCVSRTSNRQPFHDQVGYWLWEATTGTIVQSLMIPRAVGLLAAGRWSSGPAPVVLEVASAADDASRGVVQSPFMREKARTVGFRHRVVVGGGTSTYDETTIVDIYGKRFEHTDTNTLTRA